MSGIKSFRFSRRCEDAPAMNNSATASDRIFVAESGPKGEVSLQLKRGRITQKCDSPHGRHWLLVMRSLLGDLKEPESYLLVLLVLIKCSGVCPTVLALDGSQNLNVMCNLGHETYPQPIRDRARESTPAVRGGSYS